MSEIADGEFIEPELLPTEYIDEWANSDVVQDAQYGHVSTATRPSIHYVNEAGIPEDVIERHFRQGRVFQEISSIVEQWTQSLNTPGAGTSLDLFNRHSKYRPSENHCHSMMARCAWAVEHDDTLSTLADVLQSLMWRKCKFELINDDEENFWNQWARRINLDRMLREIGREKFKTSNVYVGLWWEQETFQVEDDEIADKLKKLEAERQQVEFEKKRDAREAWIEANKGEPDFIEPPPVPEPPDSSPGPGNRKRRKKYQLVVPTSYTIFDPTKIMPVGQLMFGKERFAYVATRSEDEAFSKVMAGNAVDGTVLQLIEQKYTPSEQDRQACQQIEVDPDRLWLLKSNACFRHSATKASYERFASPRLEPALDILSMKEHLRNSDRATLIGNTNFIIVITKGTDKLPARPSEIEHLQGQARMIARLPVLVGDHRLHVEIIAPATDHTLQDSRWQVLDSRLVFMALRTFSPVSQGGNSGAGAGVTEMSRVVSTGLEDNRHMIVRDLERHVFAVMVQRNQDLEEFPGLAFRPKRITLDFNADIIGQVLKLRDRGDISRETTLEELDYDQDTEVVRRGQERIHYDPVFESQTPFSSPGNNPYATTMPGQQPPPPGQLPPGQQPPAQPANNLGPAGQPRTEGGRPAGAKDARKRAAKKAATGNSGAATPKK